ncbi:hypothetical protein [Paraburkholderia largidicola]|uniref:Uncharacterized protein n=1 Tax=Paraburkholderia largidicola TaxID=3014751 RepID=A0A7I8C2I0_9BURK|nr:hypothetical protein [Paraburkholderia sp. PGU16]BCF95277.1 hypothetical protein PPGU16_83440 [Paraburkholderia sp. PGU16]
MPVTVEPAASINWVTVVASSALVSAVVNVGWNAISKLLDRRHENAKDKQRIDHVKLEIMDQLESFANRCASLVYDIHEGLAEYYRHEPNPFSDAQRSVELKFDPEPRWVELPIRFVAPLRALMREYTDAAEWITRSGVWADTADQYESELERLAFYGLEVLTIAEKIRTEIDAGERGTAQLEASRAEFNGLIEQRRDAYKKRPLDVTFIPELEAQFEREMPDHKSLHARIRKAEIEKRKAEEKTVE